MTTTTSLRPIRTTGIARDLTVWLVIGCFILTAPVAFWGYRTVVVREEQALDDEAAACSARLAEALRQHIWNIDGTAIDAYFNAYPVPDHLVYVHIATQYGDPIYDYTVSADQRVTTHRRRLVHGDEPIGVIEVGLSRAGIEADRLHMAKVTVLMALALALAIGLLSAVLIRVLLGRSLSRLIRHLRAVADGDYHAGTPPHRYREMDAINTEVNLMAARIAHSTGALQAEIEERRRAEQALQSMTEHLEELVERRTVQLREVNEALLGESMMRRKVQHEILEISNREQRRIGQDLHDSLCQELAGIAYLAGSLERNLTVKASPDKSLAKQIASLLRESVSHIRRVAKGLTPVGLDADGLFQALKEVAEDTRRFFNVECHFVCSGDGLIYRSSTAIHLLHITQEAVHNAVRHGKASQIELQLQTENGTGTLVIRDNGGGFNLSSPVGRGMGLHTMAYRAEIIGGHLDMTSEPSSGTVITVTFDTCPPGDDEPTEVA